VARLVRALLAQSPPEGPPLGQKIQWESRRCCGPIPTGRLGVRHELRGGMASTMAFASRMIALDRLGMLRSGAAGALVMGP
jgi:hypothetical protein